MVGVELDAEAFVRGVGDCAGMEGGDLPWTGTEKGEEMMRGMLVFWFS